MTPVILLAACLVASTAAVRQDLDTISAANWPLLKLVHPRLIERSQWAVVAHFGGFRRWRPQVLLHTRDRKTYMIGSSTYFGFRGGRASVEEVAELRGVVLQDAKFTTDMDIPALVLLSSTGEVWTAGDNRQSTLGRPTRTAAEEARFTKVPGVTGVQEIAVGDAFVLARTADKVYAWGTMYPGANVNTQVVYSATGGNAPVQIAAGARHAVIRTRSGQIKTWGANNALQLARTGVSTVRAPADVARVTAAQVVCGDHFTLVLTSAGELYGWGSNRYAALAGATRSAQVATPTRIDVDGRRTPVASVRVSHGSILAVTSTARTYFWGAYKRNYIQTPQAVYFIHPRDVFENSGVKATGGKVAVATTGLSLGGHSHDYVDRSDILQSQEYNSPENSLHYRHGSYSKRDLSDEESNEIDATEQQKRALSRSHESHHDSHEDDEATDPEPQEDQEKRFLFRSRESHASHDSYDDDDMARDDDAVATDAETQQDDIGRSRESHDSNDDDDDDVAMDPEAQQDDEKRFLFRSRESHASHDSNDDDDMARDDDVVATDAETQQDEQRRPPGRSRESHDSNDDDDDDDDVAMDPEAQQDDQKPDEEPEDFDFDETTAPQDEAGVQAEMDPEDFGAVEPLDEDAVKELAEETENPN